MGICAREIHGITRYRAAVKTVNETCSRPIVEAVGQTAQVVAQTADSVDQVVEIVTRLANVTHVGFTDINSKINALVDAQIRTEENVARTEENVARTNENLTNFIAAVDRRFREDRNGK